jgi:uncharacterized protein YxjI
MAIDERFQHAQFLIRRKVLKLVGGAFHVFDPAGNVVFYSKMKAFKLREDIRLYTGEDMQQELVTINARQIVDWAAAYDVVDARTGQKVGALKRRGWKSVVRDSWIVMDPQDNEIGSIIEDSTGRAVLRRLLGELVSVFMPQRYHFEIGGQPVATGQQNRNPFVYTVTLDFSKDTMNRLDRRLGLAAGLLLAAIEGKQN